MPVATKCVAKAQNVLIQTLLIVKASLKKEAGNECVFNIQNSSFSFFICLFARIHRLQRSLPGI